MRHSYSMVIAVAVAGLLAAVRPAVSETQGESAPPLRSVCDTLKEDETTVGLYKFCVTFCEYDELSVVEELTVNKKSFVSGEQTPSRLCLGFWAAVPADVGPPKGWRVYSGE